MSNLEWCSADYNPKNACEINKWYSGTYASNIETIVAYSKARTQEILTNLVKVQNFLLNFDQFQSSHIKMSM